jgi:hypothetical protein
MKIAIIILLVIIVVLLIANPVMANMKVDQYKNQINAQTMLGSQGIDNDTVANTYIDATAKIKIDNYIDNHVNTLADAKAYLKRLTYFLWLVSKGYDFSER